MENNIAKTLSSNIKLYMDYYDITQTELSKRMGVAQSTISFWINGERIPRMLKIDELCSIFKCTRSDLIINMQTSESIHSSAKKAELESKISSLNESGVQKVCDYIDDLSDKYRL